MPGQQPSMSPDPDDEELRTGGTRWRPPRVTLLIAGGLALCAVVVVGVLTAGHGRSGAHHRASPAPSSGVRASSTGPVVPLAARCPSGARCSTVRDLPVTTTSALRAVLPDVVVTAAVSVLANRVGHFEPDLVARRVDALAGDGNRLALRITPAPAGTEPLPTGVVYSAITARGATAQGRVDGYVASADLDVDPARTTARAQAAALRAVRDLVVAAALTDAQ